MRVFIVDDDELVVESLEIILSSDPSLDFIGSAVEGGAALEAIREARPDLVLMDIRMPGMDGIEATRRIKEAFPELKIIMLTTFHDYRSIHRSLQAGASGYLLKSDPTAKQLRTIKAVYEGLPVISDRALKALAGPASLAELSPRENELLTELANGLSNKEIAEHLYLSEGTVRNMISSILDKLGLRDRTQLAIFYWQNKGA